MSDKPEKTNDLPDIAPEVFTPDAVIEGERKFMNPEEIASYFLPGGRVETTFGEGYEFRKEQQSVTREITAAFNGDSISLLEAPTGTGKTLSYLVPAARWALLNKERIVISTNTINLQDQIINKDMPMLKNILGEDIRYSLVKGMRNYLCLLRADSERDELRTLFEDENAENPDSKESEERAIVEWAGKTSAGSVSDLGFEPSGEVWDKFAAESESCVKRECPHYKECFFFKARRKVAESDIIVVNHHLLFSDIAIKESSGREDAGVLPQNRRLVIDEAHNVVDSATSHFSMRASTAAVAKTLGRLRKVVARSEKAARKMKRADSASANTKVFKALSGMQRVFMPRIDALMTASEIFFESLGSCVLPSRAANTGAQNMRVTKTDLEQGGNFYECVEPCAQIRASALGLASAVKDAAATLADVGADDAALVSELKAALNGLVRLADVAGLFAGAESFEEFVKSVEIRRRGKKVFTAVSLSPIDIAAQLKKIYAKYGTVIMTSATLTAEGGFDFQKRSLGLTENHRLSELAVPSPFRYEDQALLALATDVPEPSRENHTEKLTEAVFDCVTAAGGGALVLFNSYQMLRKVSSALSPRLAEKGVKVLTQGDLPREKLLAGFKSDENSALFATDSFREGVDIAGNALRLVVITRLPFRVPDEPVFQARMEAITAAGGDAFSRYAVPMAVVGFRQGFGRLIRAATDKGAVAVLDSRIVSKGYGKRFVESVPKCRTVRAPSEKVAREIKGILSAAPELLDNTPAT